jgi:hypothetical protein
MEGRQPPQDTEGTNDFFVFSVISVAIYPLF